MVIYKENNPQKNMLANIAMDCAINQFNPYQLPKDCVTVETIAKMLKVDVKTINKKETAEYYFNLLMQQQKENNNNGEGEGQGQEGGYTHAAPQTSVVSEAPVAPEAPAAEEAPAEPAPTPRPDVSAGDNLSTEEVDKW
jgi:predicted metal-dependent peptidase